MKTEPATSRYEALGWSEDESFSSQPGAECHLPLPLPRLPLLERQVARCRQDQRPGHLDRIDPGRLRAADHDAELRRMGNVEGRIGHAQRYQ